MTSNARTYWCRCRTAIPSRWLAESEPFLTSEALRERVAWAVTAFAQRLQAEGQPLLAEALATAAVQIGKTRVGERQQYTIYAMYALGNIHRVQGRLEEAEPLLVRACEPCCSKRALEHSGTAPVNVERMPPDKKPPASSRPGLEG